MMRQLGAERTEMDQQDTAVFSIMDVRALAEYVLAECYACDASNHIGRDGLRYCTACGAYEDRNGKISHDPDCVTMIAQDVLTGLPPNDLVRGASDEPTTK